MRYSRTSSRPNPIALKENARTGLDPASSSAPCLVTLSAPVCRRAAVPVLDVNWNLLLLDEPLDHAELPVLGRVVQHGELRPVPVGQDFLGALAAQDVLDCVVLLQMHQLKEVLPVGDELETKAPAGVGGLHHLGDPRGDLALHSPHRERVCVEMLLREAGEIRRVVHHKASVLHVLHKGLRGAARGRRAHVPLDALVVVHLLRRPAARYPGQVHVEGPSQSQHPEGLLQSDQAISVAESVGVLAQHDVEALILEGQVEHGPLHEGEVPFALHARHGRRDGLLDDVQPHEAALREPLRQRADGVALAAAHVQHADALLQPLLMLSHELLGGGLSSGAQLAPRLWVASRKDVCKEDTSRWVIRGLELEIEETDAPW
eukprot:scaffold1023_cov313-Pinguiococcus_pyrenoidosus.AAC.2